MGADSLSSEPPETPRLPEDLQPASKADYTRQEKELESASHGKDTTDTPSQDEPSSTPGRIIVLLLGVSLSVFLVALVHEPKNYADLVSRSMLML